MRSKVGESHRLLEKLNKGSKEAWLNTGYITWNVICIKILSIIGGSEHSSPQTKPLLYHDEIWDSQADVYFDFET